MRAGIITTLMLAVALTLAGCVANPISQASPTGQSTAPAVAANQPTATAAGSQANPTAAASTSTASSSQSATSSQTQSSASASAADAATVAAVKAVIQKANDEQQQAFAKNDPTIMKDTSTAEYYNEMVATNSDMANGGVSAIKLVKIEWGNVTLTNATTANATTYETWQTTYSDGSTDQSRDLNAYVLVQQNGNWLIQSDDHPDSNQPGGQSATAPSSPTNPSNPTSPSAPSGSVSPTGADVSRNWSGYAATGGQYTAVTGTWVVPDSNGSTAGFGGGATWVGIGGVTGRDLIQAGTQEIASSSGTVNYSAWIEMLPAASKNVNLTVRPGDSITVTIKQTSTGQWSIVLNNNTTGGNYQTTVSYDSSLSSVEWVMEAPSAGRRVVTLDNFGTVKFSNGSAVKDGKTVTIAQSGAQPISMLDAYGNIAAKPSALTADGGGFSVDRSDTQVPVVPTNPGRGFPGQGAQPSLPAQPSSPQGSLTIPLPAYQ